MAFQTIVKMAWKYKNFYEGCKQNKIGQLVIPIGN
jgi:hypothetical protein